MPSLWEVLKTSKGLPAPDGFTALFAHSLSDTYTLHEISGIPPLNLGEIVEIVDYTIYGNAVQAATPSPDNPVEVQAVGDRTRNLITNETTTAGYYLDSSGILNNVSHEYLKYLQPVEVKPNTTYTLSTNTTIYTYWTSDVSDTINEGIKKVYVNDSKVTITTGENERYLRISISERNAGFEWLMLNAGETALPYEPYGYKIPITCGGQTTPVYLGEVPTVRRVRKLVLDGTESYIKDNAGEYLYYIYVTHLYHTDCSCSHLTSTTSYPVSKEGCSAYNNALIIYLNFGADIMNAQSSGNTTAGLKEYLSSQYAAGTPVTIWYVLANEETAIVNEPLCKIGDYADTLCYAEQKDERYIKELILTGDENWKISYTYKGSFYARILTGIRFPFIDAYCTHAIQTKALSTYTYGKFYLENNSNDYILNLFIGQPEWTIDDFKSYLAAQYAAGTPVTVYYVLAEPETETVELPEIPTLDGTTVIDVDTEIKPSNLKITYKSRR